MQIPPVNAPNGATCCKLWPQNHFGVLYCSWPAWVPSQVTPYPGRAHHTQARPHHSQARPRHTQARPDISKPGQATTSPGQATPYAQARPEQDQARPDQGQAKLEQCQASQGLPRPGLHPGSFCHFTISFCIFQNFASLQVV